MEIRKLLRINFTLQEILSFELTNHMSLISHHVKANKLGC
jgi:hypothetical protein